MYFFTGLDNSSCTWVITLGQKKDEFTSNKVSSFFSENNFDLSKSVPPPPTLVFSSLIYNCNIFQTQMSKLLTFANTDGYQILEFNFTSP